MARPKRQRYLVIPDSVKREIVTLFDAGKNTTQIAYETQVSRNSIIKILRENGREVSRIVVEGKIQCGKCGQWLDATLDNFYENTSATKKHLSAWCKDCTRQYEKERREKTPRKDVYAQNERGGRFRLDFWMPEEWNQAMLDAGIMPAKKNGGLTGLLRALLQKYAAENGLDLPAIKRKKKEWEEE